MSAKKEIEAAAVATIKCPSCGAEPGKSCHFIGSGGGLARVTKVKTHQRRLSTFVAGNIREKLMKTSPPYRVGRPGTIVSDNAEGLTLGGATGEDAVEHYGGNLIAESMSPDNAEFFSRAGNAHDPLVAALLRAKETIRVFNGMGMKGEVEQACWDAYQHSPEMKEINAAIAIANGEQVQTLNVGAASDNQVE